MKTHQKPTVKPTPTHSPPEKPNPAWCGFSNRKPTPTHIISTSSRRRKNQKRVIKKRVFKAQSQDAIMRYSQQQSDFVSQQTNFMSQNFSQLMSAQYMQFMIQSQQFQNFQQSIISDSIESQILQNLDFIESQVSQNSDSSVSFSANSIEEIFNVSIESNDDKHTQFLNMMIDMNKIFRISCFVIKSNDETVALNKQYTQTDQRSNMNVVFMNLTRRLELQLRDLVEMNFRELFMKTADNHDIIFYHWVWIRMFVADILRDIRCFVVSKITQIIAVEQIEHLSLILRLSWLYFVNAFISIRKFKIIIDDVNIDEIVREMIDFELVFCKNHNLLMYSKFVMTSFSEKNSIVKNVFDSFDFDSFSDDLSDVNDSSDANF